MNPQSRKYKTDAITESTRAFGHGIEDSKCRPKVLQSRTEGSTNTHSISNKSVTNKPESINTPSILDAEGQSK